ncbi:hypothetical protein VPNG_09483 [Cytospora leucostoma]|uniref:HTH myb-type domain-containing protein n=1 Tax=Cytospora leucostoma TaxID=1230097 RepID=A0A423VVF3_9PEZI|nr:hypothetical protein VPNG_09483 [Cytospora leucostoma]
MAIRDRWNRMLRKSAGSSSSSSEGSRRSDDGRTSPTSSATATPNTTRIARTTPPTPTATTPRPTPQRPTPTRTTTAPGNPNASRTPRRPPINKMASWRSQNGYPTNPHKEQQQQQQHQPQPPTSSTKPSLRHRPLSGFFKPHPRDKLPTEQNLRYQESLGNFRWEFGRSRPSSRGSVDSYDISPCQSRAGSLDYGEGGGCRGSF